MTGRPRSPRDIPDDTADRIEKAVGDAFWDWIQNERPISTMETIERAVENAFTRWLDAHRDAVIAAIADRAQDD